jgi:FkbM family methyltransferase
MELIKTKKFGFDILLRKGKYMDQSILSNTFETKEINSLNGIINPDMNVIDVGANIGFYTLFFASIVKNGNIFAFEPIESFYKRLTEVININNIQNVICEKLIVSDSCSEIDIFLGDCSARIHPEDNIRWDFSKKEKVKSTTLDNYIDSKNIDKIDFIKIDVDGHEIEVLNGAKNSLNKFSPIMMVEFSKEAQHYSGHSLEELTDTLSNLGYKFFNLSGQELKLKKFRSIVKNIRNTSVDFICKKN